MPGQQHKRKRLAQNFLKDPVVVRGLVQIAKIRESDTVFEVGPGKGIITAELGRIAKSVIAIEKDPALVRRLRERFREDRTIEIVERDFLDYPITQTDYKIFANIPFNLTADIVRKILWTQPTPTEAFLIMQREPAIKYSGICGETLFSVLAKPYFELGIAARLKKSDFLPMPTVDSVLLRISRRARPLLSRTESRLYQQFVTLGFAGWKPNLRTAYKRVFTYPQWKRLAHDLGFERDSTPTQLTIDQWLTLYRMYRKLSE